MDLHPKNLAFNIAPLDQTNINYFIIIKVHIAVGYSTLAQQLLFAFLESHVCYCPLILLNKFHGLERIPELFVCCVKLRVSKIACIWWQYSAWRAQSLIL